MEALQQIAWVPVIVSAGVTFLLGGLWYSLLFKAAWVAAHGYTPEQMESMKKQGMAKPLLGTFLANLVTAAAFSILVSYLHLSAPIQGVKLGLLVWIGFVATILLIRNFYSTVKFSGFMIDASYQLVFFAVIGCILTAWK